MKILGLHVSFNGFSHDSSASLIIDGKVIGAVEEERYNRLKSSQLFFPKNSIKYCLEKAKCDITNIDVLVVDGITFKKLRQKIKKSMNFYFGYCPKIYICEHSHSHSYGSFLSSGYDESLVVSIDGVGDKVSTLVSKFKKINKKVVTKVLYKDRLENSLGDFYGVFTNYLGFRLNEGEYKVMGMAAYGKPRYDLKNLINFDEENGKIVSNLKSIISRSINSNINEPIYNEKKIFEIIKVRKRNSSDRFLQKHFDLAASVQKQFTEVYIKLINYYKNKSKLESICLSGGCALNCLANNKLLKTFKKVYVMPASSDRGLSLGNAMLYTAKNLINVKKPKNMFLGPSYTNKEILYYLNRINLNYKITKNLYEDCATDIKKGKIVGWFQGRSEFGPRALGSRSILANPKINKMKKILNQKIKYREDYRPFAPSILDEDIKNYSNFIDELEYMTFTLNIDEKLKKLIPEAVHFDNTARIHVVKKNSNPIFYNLLKCVKKEIGIGSVINTSFNVNNEPIVNSPLDAIKTFFSSGIDVLYLNNIKIVK
jgi:carbamoyltransferase